MQERVAVVAFVRALGKGNHELSAYIDFHQRYENFLPGTELDYNWDINKVNHGRYCLHQVHPCLRGSTWQWWCSCAQWARAITRCQPTSTSTRGVETFLPITDFDFDGDFDFGLIVGGSVCITSIHMRGEGGRGGGGWFCPPQGETLRRPLVL